MSQIRVGVLGCGVVADYGHVPSINGCAGLKMHTVFDPDLARAQDLARRQHVPNAVGTLEDFFATDPQAVVIASPAPTHRANVEACAAKGLPILCEKPLAMDEAEAASMKQTCDDAGVPLFCGFCYRFSPAAMQIRNFVKERTIGDVRSLRLIYNWDCHGKYMQDADGKWVIDPRRHERMLEGGPMFDCGTHQIDLARWWLGDEVVKATGHGAWVETEDYEAPDHAWLHMDFAGGAHACVEMSYTYGHTTRDKFSEFVYELIGTGGMIRYSRNDSFFELRTHERTERLPYHHEKDFPGMYDHFSRYLHHGEAGDLCTAEDAIRVTQLAREATRSAVEHRPAPASVK